MRGAAAVVALALAVIACSRSETKPKPLSEPGERVYKLRGNIVGRSSADNTLRIDHEAIAGYMEAMTMDYSVRGVNVSLLPPVGSRVEATLHVTDNGYWLTDVKAAP